MKTRIAVLAWLIVSLTAGMATADIRIVKLMRSDAIAGTTDTGQAKETRSTFWLSEDRMRLDQADTSIIVRLDEKKMYILSHREKTFSPVTLPLDLSTLLPPGVGAQMLKMMQFTVTVTPTEEKRTIGEWKARRYDVTMVSSMARVDKKVWAATNVGFDTDKYKDLYDQIMLLQPGMQQLVSEMRKVEGFEVESESIMRMTAMSGQPMGTSDRTESIDTADPPEGNYSPPAGYQEKPFDFSTLAQGGR